MAGALNGIRVLDFSHMFSGPFCTLLLRDLGAEVIKVERPRGGDPVRGHAPKTRASESGSFIILNRGKKSVTLELSTEKGRRLCKELVRKVDVVVENFSPGTMEKLGLGSRELCELNPSLIFASVSAYGHSGPRRDGVGYDPVAQAMGGITSVTGLPGGPPTKCGVAIADLSAGLFTALAIAAAVVHRLRTGEGQVIDISLQDCVWLFSSVEYSPYYFLQGRVPERTGNGHPAMCPGNLYPAENGSVIVATSGFEQVQRLFRLIGGEELLRSPICGAQEERLRRRDEIDSVIGDWTSTRTTDEIERQLKAIDVPCSTVPTFEQVCTDPHLISREMIIDVEQALSGKTKVPGSLFKLSKTPGDVAFPAPLLGESNDEVYGQLLGYGDEVLSELKAEGVI